MANTTLFVLLVASLCLIGEGAPVNPGKVKGLIHATRGRSTGALNAVLGIALKKQMATATTEIQKNCIGKSVAEGKVEGQRRLSEVTTQLLAEYQTVDPTADINAIKENVDATFKQVVEEVVKSSISNMQKC